MGPPVDAPERARGHQPHGPADRHAPAREWNRIVADEDARVSRYRRPATVVIVELDGLERLTRALGPDAADRLVPAVADTIRRLARGADHVARLGPAASASCCPRPTRSQAINYVERIRAACELWLESGAIAMRLAIGWASPAGDDSLWTPSAMAERADVRGAASRRAARGADRGPVATTRATRPRALNRRRAPGAALSRGRGGTPARRRAGVRRRRRRPSCR